MMHGVSVCMLDHVIGVVHTHAYWSMDMPRLNDTNNKSWLVITHSGSPGGTKYLQSREEDNKVLHMTCSARSLPISFLRFWNCSRLRKEITRLNSIREFMGVVRLFSVSLLFCDIFYIYIVQKQCSWVQHPNLTHSRNMANHSVGSWGAATSSWGESSSKAYRGGKEHHQH